MNKTTSIKKVLFLLEKTIESEQDLAIIETLAKKHLQNVSQLSDLQIQIDKLTHKQAELTLANSDVQNDILKIMGNTKSQSLRFGKILVDFKVIKTKRVTRDAPRWKDIVAALAKQYKIEERIVKKLHDKLNNGNQLKTDIDREFSITKESRQSKQLMREGLIDRLHNIWVGFKEIFNSLFGRFKSNNDYLENLLKSL